MGSLQVFGAQTEIISIPKKAKNRFLMFKKKCIEHAYTGNSEYVIVEYYFLQKMSISVVLVKKSFYQCKRCEEIRMHKN